MSYSYNLASSEFNLLCQAQIKLLTQALGALWSAVYLTEESVQNKEPSFFPFMIYPQTESKLYQKLPEIELPEIWQQVISKPINNPNFLLPDQVRENSLSNKLKKSHNLDNKQLILPLIYETTVMGLLIIAREEGNWQDQELKQAENIAATLAIARFMESQSQWYRKQLRLQQEANHWQKDRLDDLLHQLRNPLTALKTFSKLLLKKLLPEDPNQSFAESILRESNRLSGLLAQFEAEVEEGTPNPATNKSLYPPALPAPDQTPMTFSTSSVRLSDKNTKERHNFLLPDSQDNLAPVELTKILEPLLITAQAIAAEKEVNLIVDLPPKMPQVKGNAPALREVFNNLIDNAIKYTPASGKVKIECKRQNGLIGLVIQDTGCGIPSEVQPQIFQRYYRGIQAAGDIPGTGLGLAIANDLMQKMQGSIELISPNKLVKDSKFPGTTFIVWMSQI